MKPPQENRSSRTLSPLRVLAYRFVALVGAGIIEILWRTCRVTVLSEERLDSELKSNGAIILAFWHCHLVMLARYLVVKRSAGLRLGFVISPSVDGEAAAMLARLHHGNVIRGSSNYTGSRAARHMIRAVNEGISPAITPDGPTGPRFEFKPGALFVSQLTGKPVIPLSYAAAPAYQLRTWDRFVLPVPFSRVVIAVGKPVLVPRETSSEGLEEFRTEIQQQMLELYRQAAEELARVRQ